MENKPHLLDQAGCPVQRGYLDLCNRPYLQPIYNVSLLDDSVEPFRALTNDINGQKNPKIPARLFVSALCNSECHRQMTYYCGRGISSPTSEADGEADLLFCSLN